ncbi:peptidoglycan editing factor PgeF [Oceanobacillus sp. FSL K6-0127]|uniref:peptidoglycan editing factor PgeF n=1 Tax=Oceanobacillus sp. FSL K6-0127 TaxID=2921420 RepID=UPI0030EC6553
MNEVFKEKDNAYLNIEKWQTEHPGLVVGFTTRNGGVCEYPYHTLNFGFHVADEQKHVISNRERLADKLNFSLQNWVSGEQIHRTEIAHVTDQDKGKGSTSYTSSIKGTDGLLTNQKGVLCTAFFADCVPLFFFDPIKEYIGIAHAGWKGSVNRIAEKMVEAFAKVGVKPENLFVAIGPCISQQNYEVDERVIQSIRAGERENAVRSLGKNRFLLDLKQLNIDILLQSGVLRHNIEVTNYCTYRDDELFFSHRRDHGKTGRMLGFIGFQG